MSIPSASESLPMPSRVPPTTMYGAVVLFFVALGLWLVADLSLARDKILADTAQRALQRSQIISQSLRAQVLATDYVLRDVLGRIDATDLVYPDPDPVRSQRLTALLKEKAGTVPDFFSMVLFDRDCVFTATPSGQNTGVRSKPALCEARKQHRHAGPMTTYVPGSDAASGRPVIVLSRHLTSPSGDFLGGVLGVIELERAQLRLNELVLGEGESVALLDDAQVLLARRPLWAPAMEQPVTAFAVPPTGAVSATGTAVPTERLLARRDVDGTERLLGFSTIDGFPFTIVYGFDKARALAEWRRRAYELAIGYGVLLLLAFVVMRSLGVTLRQREALRSSEEHFRMLAENMADIVWRTDARMRFTYINAADERVRGFSRAEVVGTLVRDNLSPQGLELLDAHLQQRRATEASAQKGAALKFELPMRHKQGGEVWLEMSSVPVYGSDDHIHGYQGVGRDVSRRRQHEKTLVQSNQQLEHQLHQAVEEKSALQELATRDPLTGLYNRRFLDDSLSREWARAEREQHTVVAIMLDLDHFKKVNDQHGHAVGDEVLKALAALLRKGARESDLIWRYGGEEFVAIMPNMSVQRACERVETWRQQLEATPVRAGGTDIHITLSAGLAVYPTHGSSLAEVLARADDMLYRSKREGRNRVTVCPTDTAM